MRDHRTAVTEGLEGVRGSHTVEGLADETIRTGRISHVSHVPVAAGRRT